MKKPTHTRLILMALAAATLPVTAQVGFDGDTSNPGDWEDPANWTGNALPTGGDQTLIGVDNGVNPGTSPSGSIVSLSSDQSVGELKIGGQGFTGTVNHSAGTLTSAGGWVFVGVDASGTGNYNLSGTGSFVQDSPVFDANRRAYVGQSSSTGVLSVADNASFTVNNLNIGIDNANGTVNQTGGSIVSNSWTNVGSNAGTAEYNLSGGSFTQANDNVTIAENGTSTGVFNVSGNAVFDSTNASFFVGRFDSANGTLNISGSDASINSLNMTVSATGTATGEVSFTADAGGVSTIGLTQGLTLGALANLTVDLSAFSGTGEVVLIETEQGTIGTFAGLAEGAVVPGSGGRTITYLGGDGNDVSLVPEPTGLVLTLLGGLMFFRRRR